MVLATPLHGPIRLAEDGLNERAISVNGLA